MNDMALPGVRFREQDFIPTFHKFKREYCRGLQLHITDRETFQPFRTALLLIQHIRKTHEEFEFSYRPDIERYQMDILLGKDDFRREDFEPERFIAEEQAKIEKFLPNLRPYYLYG